MFDRTSHPSPRTGVIDVALSRAISAAGAFTLHPVDHEAVRRRPPGRGLLEALTAVEVADVDDAILLDTVAGWERLASWVVGRQAEALRELSRRRAAAQQERFVGDEVAARLAITRSAAESKVGLALRLAALPEVEDELLRGHVDARKASVLVDETAHLSERAAHEVVATVLGDARRLTAPRIRARIRRLELAQDPAAGQARHERCRSDRHVTLDSAPDAMAWITAYLPADDAMAVWAAVSSLADSADPADPRPVGARRADALVDLSARVLDSGLTPDGTALRRRGGRHPHLEVHASATTLLGLDEAPGELVGHGPIPASMARRIAARSTWTPLLVDAHSGRPLARAVRSYRPSAGLSDAVVARDRTCTFPGCRTRARLGDLDHAEAFDPSRPAELQTTAENLHALCRHHHLAKTHAGWDVHRDPSTDRTHWRAPTGHTYTTEPPAPLVPPVPPSEPPGPGSRDGTTRPTHPHAARHPDPDDASTDRARGPGGAADPVPPDGPAPPPPF